ncbi:MAG: carbohydrate-binding domain-containing protein [Blautia sp.]|nr:carbohydrate-binding domain-containing protein [Blautia sp.]
MNGNRIWKGFTGAAALSGLLLSLLTGGFSPVSVYGQESYLNEEEIFTDRDLAQTADLSEAQSITVTDGEDIHITKEGVYVINGAAQNVTVYIEAGDEDKVQLVLDNVTIANADFPCIYVKSADKVFLTMASDSSFTVTGDFVPDGDTNTDGVIFSRSDLTLNGSGVLVIQSTDNGIVSKDDLKVTGGSYKIEAASKAFEANDSICIASGEFHLKAGTDALHAENDEDDTLGYVYIKDGSFDIMSGDDGIHGTSIVQIDGGNFTISAAEGIESTIIQINDGTVDIASWDDGINGARKSDSFTPTVEINGGQISIAMNSGDTDAIDCNGNLMINGGYIDLSASSGFDYDGNGQYNGGTIILNGQQLNSLPNQMGMGRSGDGGMDGRKGRHGRK